MMKQAVYIDEEPSIQRWESQLASTMRGSIDKVRTGSLDFSMRRPSRRSYLRGFPLPGLVNPDPIILVVYDTSGSMGKEQIAVAMRETVGVMRQTGIQQLQLMQVDAEVASEPKLVRISDLQKLDIHGRGGTNFCPAFEAAEKMRPRPNIILYMTDGGGLAPRKAPRGIQTIWLVVPSPYQRVPAQWGKLIVMSNERRIRKAYQPAA
jgi:predicted metal-dependent peptidase